MASLARRVQPDPLDPRVTLATLALRGRRESKARLDRPDQQGQQDQPAQQAPRVRPAPPAQLVHKVSKALKAFKALLVRTVRRAGVSHLKAALLRPPYCPPLETLTVMRTLPSLTVTYMCGPRQRGLLLVRSLDRLGLKDLKGYRATQAQQDLKAQQA